MAPPPVPFRFSWHDYRCRRFFSPVHRAWAYLTPSEANVLFFLAAHRGRFRSLEDLIDFLYPDDPDGGPLTVKNVIADHLVKLRRVLPAGAIVRTAGMIGLFL